MHPILFEIPLTWLTVAFVALLFGAGGLVRARFAPAERNASYLADFLGMNVQWGKVIAPWGEAATKGVMSAASAGAVAAAVKYVAAAQFGKTAIPLHIYGLMMATAFVLGIGLAMRQATREGLPDVVLRDPKGFELKDKDGKKVTITAADLVSDLGFWLLVAGLAGSRVLYIITRWKDEYSRNPLKVLQIWEGGLVWYGGLIAATIVAWRFVRQYRISFWPYADVLVPGVSLGHGIGRLGCFAAGCCFGNVARPGFPVTVQFPEGSPAFAEHVNKGLLEFGAHASLPVYPTQLMEAFGETIIFFTLMIIRSRKRFHGQVLLSYFFLYPLLRTVIEMFRGDSIRGFLFHWPEKGHEMLLSTSQAVSILMALAGMGLTWGIIRARGKQAPAGETKAA
jgi:phosphatidylglycerol:prolipoprotein diacylglycerol transferase